MSNSSDNIPITTLEPHIVYNEYRCYTRSTRFLCDYTWTIQNFKLYICQEQRNIIKSPMFSAGEDTCKWFLELYTPCADYENTKLYLKTSYNKAEIENFGPITGELRCSIVNSDGQKKNTQEKNIILNSSKLAAGFDKFMNGRNIFTDGKLFPGNELTIHCTLCYIQQKKIVDHISNQRNLINTYPPSPMEDFEKLFNNEELSDVTIYVGDEKYSAHKNILAIRSSVFKAMFAHNFKETQSNRIDINDIDEKTFKEVLRYIYTGKVENIETMAFELLSAADEYDLRVLKMMCENELCRTLVVDTAVKMLLLSITYNLQDLKSRAIEYIKLNLTKILGSEGWNDLISKPDLMKTVLEALK